MIVVASANGAIGVDAAWAVLEAGGSPLDAVEAGIRVVEDNPDDHSVGTGGLPNYLGEVELDASVMEGTTRRAGAVAALQGFRHPVSVARAVMERLPHVLVVGAGAARFAAEIGAERGELLTAEAERIWREGLEATPGGLAGSLLEAVRAATTDPERAAGTVDFLAMDDAGRIASAVSTSGWAWKWPGRVGDSPLPGCGNYCDDRFGAAACTGLGELAIRAGTARRVVDLLGQSVPIEEALRRAVSELGDLGESTDRVVMSVVALDRDGRHAAASTQAGATYAWRDGTSRATVISPRQLVVLPVGG